MAMVHYLNAARDINETRIPSVNDFYSVEIKIDDVNCMYQFKLWKMPSEPSFVLVKPESGIMKWIHPGDVLHMTYYGDNLTYQKRKFPTRILNIDRQDEGRFRGHYIVKLGIVEN